jgi:hypothetical protein
MLHKLWSSSIRLDIDVYDPYPSFLSVVCVPYLAWMALEKISLVTLCFSIEPAFRGYLRTLERG